MTAVEHVYSAWKFEATQERDGDETYRDRLHRDQFTCCMRLENGRNYMSQWKLTFQVRIATPAEAQGCSRGT